MASPFEVTLRADGSWIRPDLTSLWRYRDLIAMFVWRDFVAKYKQTILGPAWFVVQPLLLSMVFSIVFSRVAGLSTDGLPPMLFYLCGQLPWNYFAQNFASTSTTLLNGAPLFSKVYFPRLVVPIAAVLTNVLTLAIQCGTFAAFFLYYRYVQHAGSFGLDWHAVFLPLVVLQIIALSLGIGLIMSAATAKYRDLTHLSGVLIQIWMYLTPVIYPLASFPPRWRWVLALNPMAPPVECFRLMLLGTGSVEPRQVAVSVATSVVLLVAGLLLFARMERTFVDNV
jgi:lipopolysaccharide transport system permease protein